MVWEKSTDAGRAGEAGGALCAQRATVAITQPSARSLFMESAKCSTFSRGGKSMGATSDDLMEIARAGAERIDLPAERVRYPNFGDIEEQCSAEYDDLLNALRDDELFAPADLQRQEELVEQLKPILGS